MLKSPATPLAALENAAEFVARHIGIEEFERMSPEERLDVLRARVVTDLDELPDDFRRRVIATAESL